MTKNATCVRCDFVKEFQSSFGTLFEFNVEFSNGDCGVYSSKDRDNPKFKMGENFEYKIEEKDFGYGKFNRVSTVYNPNQQPNSDSKTGGKPYNNADNQKGIFACSALNRAVDFCVGAYGKDATLDQVKFNGVQFYNWLVDTSKR